MPITLDEALKAVKGTKGNQTEIARNLRCNHSNVTHLKKKWATFNKAVQEAKEARIDWYESRLDERAEKGDIAAIIFFLKTQGKDRGYIERQEITGAGGASIKCIRVVEPTSEAEGDGE